MRTTRCLSLALLLAILLILVPFAQSKPVTWYLSGATMQDGAVATGSFVYDADIPAYSSVNITTSGGSTLPGAAYTVVDSCYPGDCSFAVALSPSGGGSTYLVLYFFPDLSDAGGTSSLVSSSGPETPGFREGPTPAALPAPFRRPQPRASEGILGPSGETSTSVTRYFTAGTVTTTPSTPTGVPTLSALGLAILAILLVAAGATLLARQPAARQI